MSDSRPSIDLKHSAIPTPRSGRLRVPGGRVASADNRFPSPREVQILRLMGHGMCSKEIAADLGMSRRTVEEHINRMFSRYEIHARSQLMAFVVQRGWIDFVGDPLCGRANLVRRECP